MSWRCHECGGLLCDHAVPAGPPPERRQLALRLDVATCRARAPAPLERRAPRRVAEDLDDSSRRTR